MSKEESRKKISRRSFLTGSAALAVGAALASCAPAAEPTPAAPAEAATSPTPIPPTPVPATATPAPAPTGGSMTVGTVGDPVNLDPFFMQATNYPFMENVYDQFARLDAQVQPQPQIIEEWSTSADYLKLTLKMRSGVKYHDGSTATADDVAQCILRAANPDTGGHQTPSWRVVTEAIATGNDVIEVTLSQPAAYIFPAMGFISLIRPGAFDALANQEGGSGAFKVKEWVPNDYLDLEKFADYWDEGRPVLDSVRLKIFQDAAAMVSALEGGVIDMALNLPPGEFERLGQRFNMLRGQDAANFYFFAMSARHAPFDNKDVRQAIAFAIDKETICRNVLFGVSDPIELPWPKTSFAYFPEYEGMYRYDLDEAKARLADAGYPNGISFKLQYSTVYPEFGMIGEIIKASLAEIGTEVELVPMDQAQFVNLAFEGEGYQSTISFAGGTQWYPTRITLSSLYRLENNVCFPNGEPPAKWVEGHTLADSTMDPEEQKAGIKLAVDSFMDDMWSMPIAFRYTLFGMHNYVEGFSHGAYDQPRFYDVKITK